MKKALAILLVMCMAFALFACSEKSGTDAGTSGSPSPSNSGSSSPSGGGDSGTSGGDDGNKGTSSGGPKELGFYDRDYDYTQHKQFKFAYLVSATGQMYETFNQSFALWADRLNMNYTGIFAPAEATDEAFLAALEQYCDMGYDGLLIDSTPQLAPQVGRICKQYGVQWMMAMSQARDYSYPYSLMGTNVLGPLYAPNVGFNNIDVGKNLANGLINWKEEAYPDIPWEQVGFISIDFSNMWQLHERTLGAMQAWTEKNPSFGTYDPATVPKNFFLADAATGASGADLITQMLSDPPDANIKVWLIEPPFWDYAQGASTAAENLGLLDYVCITNFGSAQFASSLWEAGTPTCIRFSLETASPVYAEAIVNALWTMMAGFATADTLWPEWQVVWDKGDIFKLSDENDPVFGVPKVELDADGKPVVLEEHGYATMLLPQIWMTQDNFPQFYGWMDLYDHGPDVTEEDRTYPQYPLGKDINEFNARGTVPDFYKEWPSN